MNFEDFSRNFQAYLRVYEKLEEPKDKELEEDTLLKVDKSWTVDDLVKLAYWKRLGHWLESSIKKNSKPQVDRLNEGLGRERDNPDPIIDAISEIKLVGIGPALLSAILYFSFPEKYGVLDFHAWSALSDLGYQDIDRRSKGEFSTGDLKTYLAKLAEVADRLQAGRVGEEITARQVDKALYTYDKIWHNKWKDTFDDYVQTMAQVE
jgi:hypothetical protein